MIYLIDDKKLRQEKDYSWSSERLAKHGKFLIPIYTLTELQNRNQEIFQEGNIILYHESFIDKTQIHSEAVERRRRLEEFSQKNSSYLVYFSGSKSDRNLNENIANIPVSVLYKNLEVFIQKYSENDIKLEYLLFGENPEIEETLLQRLQEKLSETYNESTSPVSGNSLFIRPSKNNIKQPLSSSNEETIFNKYSSDEDFSEKILEWLNDVQYDNIFVPLCFGNTLSDFNGLRLATHIRCTRTLNQTKPIFIYGFVGIEYLLENEYFNILKTKNVFLIPFSKKAIGEAAEKTLPPFLIEDLPKEITKLKLDVPKNYTDNHSIANEWAIFRWAKTVDTENDAIESLTHKINSNLYFKYLQTIHPILETQKLSYRDLKINYSGTPKILYVDDEADKGWYEVFCKILYDVNNLDFNYIGDDFKNQTEDEIIESSFAKVKDYDADIVILDFRLHQNDFEKKDINEVTGIKILKKIKEYNPGIQVIVFSATNKVWNLQALQKVGADGFIVKENPENSVDGNFTKKSIQNFINSLKNANELGFLKQFYKEQEVFKKELEPRKNVKHERPIPKDFINETLKWLELSNNILSKGDFNESKLVSSFLFKFSVLENIANRIIDVDNPIEVSSENVKKKYKFQFRFSDKRLRNFIEDKQNDGFYRRTKTVFESYRNLQWNIKILNTIDFISEEKLSERDLNRIIKKRNDFIHANSTTGDKISIDVDDLKFINSIISTGLKNIV